MRVLRVIGDLGPDLHLGPAKQAYYLSRGLTRRGVTDIVYTCHIQTPEVQSEIRSRFYRPLLNIGHYRASPAMLFDLLRDRGDLVHVHGYRNFQTDSGTFLSIMKELPLVMTAHGSIANFKREFWTPMSRVPSYLYDLLTRRLVLRRADAVVVATEQEAKEIVDFGVQSRKVRVIPNGLDFPPYDVGGSNRNGEYITLLMVTRITVIRNIEFAIEGLARALKKNNLLRLLIVGDVKPSRYVKDENGYMRRLNDLCDRLGVGERVTFTGPVFGKELWDMYDNADIFLWTSWYESFGHALVEAAHFGLPIVTTPVGVGAEIIESTGGGAIISGHSRDELASAILGLVEDPALRFRMGERNMQMSEEFSVERMVDNYLALYQGLIGS